MTKASIAARPQTLHDVANQSGSIEDFGLCLRDWQHEIQRSEIHSRKQLSARLSAAPHRLTGRFHLGDVADAYLAAYAEWISDKAGIPRPAWCSDRTRCADEPWFSSPDRTVLLARSPASFRQRNLFTLPDPVFTPRRGRPRVSQQQKQQKAILRQRAYRTRIRELIREARALRIRRTPRG